VAAALQAELLLLVTAVGGVFHDLADSGSRIAHIDRGLGKQLISNGTIKDGMVPKVEEALSILDHGVGAVSILGAQEPGSFLSALRGDGQSGTRFVERSP
jgi:acetylglutamate kinase